MIVEHIEHTDENNKIGYIESVYKSDNVLKTTYFPEKNRLYITFSRDNTYSYTNVDSELYNDLENSESQGKFFHRKIKNNKNIKFRKEFKLYPSEINELKILVENHNNNNDNNSN